MKRKQYTDYEIIKGISRNNTKVLSFLYSHNFESLNRKVMLEGGIKNDTEDIFHDAFMILFLKIKNNDLHLTCSIHTFFQAIARNLWKRRIAANLPKFSMINDKAEEIEAEYSIDEEYILLERRKVYLKHMADMPNDCQRLIKKVLAGFSLQEITEQMPYNSIEFTKTKRFRCKVMLIKKIIHDPLYKELRNERLRTIGSLPRW